MKKLLLILLCLTMLLSCKSSKSALSQDEFYGAGSPTIEYKAKNVKQIDCDTFKVAQVDSMIKADKLPQLKKWSKSDLKDEETNVNYTFYTLFDNTDFIIYTLKDLHNNKFIVLKRKIK